MSTSDHQDAARYRWLRQAWLEGLGTDEEPEQLNTTIGAVYTEAEMDAAIDAVLAAHPAPAEGALTLTDEQIDQIAADGMMNAAGGIYATSVHQFARACIAAATEALQARIRSLSREAWEWSKALEAQLKAQPKGARADLLKRLREPSISGEAAKVLALEAADALDAQAPAPAPEVASAPRAFDAVKSFADSVLAMLDERIKAAEQNAHPFKDYFGDHPETIVAAKAQASELREVRTQVRILGDRALVDLMKFRPATSAPAVGEMKPAAWRYRTLAETDWTLTQIDPTGIGEVVEALYAHPPVQGSQA